ncbi:MAG: tRNA (adenosine(37)-N6)-dimethylallyltransferase MiaA [Clostridia bacterium]|nr:tRNA (adenosine(37)-N6)-dimethylallyltransferase MiaA [Clostridia bacterium]
MMKQNEKIPVLAVVGPTASGKTALAIALAQAFGGEIVSCDSMQVYRGMEIGTAQPSVEELAAVPHHLIGFLDPTEPFSVSDYVDAASAVIENIRSRNKLPVLCGGTGLYARSLLEGLAFDEFGRDDALRASLKQQAEEIGLEGLYRKLQELDPEAAEKIHPNNQPRLYRALEYCLLSGRKFSEWQKKAAETESVYNVCMLGIGFENRGILYDRINRRVGVMMEMGLEEEARGFFDRYRTTGVTSAQAIGYKELFPYFEGQRTLQEAIETIQQETRHYAKRQLAWFRREKNIHWIYGDLPPSLLEQAEPIVRNWLGGDSI